MRRAAAAGAAILVAASACAAAELPAAAGETWTEVRSRRFHVYTQGDDALARRIARHLERLAEALQETTRGFLVDGGRGVSLYVFTHRDAFRPYCPFRDDEFGNTVGYHRSGDDREYIVVDASDADRVPGFVAHEYLHAVVARSFGDFPMWLNEGLAEYYSTFLARRRTVEIGRAVPEHVAWLRSHVAPVRQILLMAGNSPDYYSGPQRQTVYAQSWALVHALALDPEDSGRRFGRLLSRISLGEQAETVMKAIYGPGVLDSLEGALRERMTRITLPYVEREFTVPVEDLSLQSRPLGRAETLTLLGELLANAPDSLIPRARAHLEAAWREDSSRAQSAAWLGTLAERSHDRPLAGVWYARATRAADADARALATVGTALANRRRQDGAPLAWPARGTGAEELRARDLLRRAMATDPAVPEWLVPFGRTFLEDTAD
ncbi:MAG: DUF1570 domain-containing protein, partial [Candidatus Eisenbacteria bacterium]